MYAARHLGVEGFGILSFALAFTGIFSIFSDLGLQQLTIRNVARDKSSINKYLGNVAGMKMILVTFTFGLIALTINLLGYPEETIRVVYLIALNIILTAFTGMFNSIFQAFEKMKFVSVGRILNSVLLLSGALFAINQGFSVVGFAFLYFLVSVIILVYSFVICAWKFVLPKIEVDWGFWKPTMKEALPFGLSGIFVSIYFWIDSIMLSLMQGDEVVGWYNAAYRLIYVLLFIPGAYFSSVYPIMSRFYKTSDDSLKFAYEKSMKYIMIIAYPIVIGVTFFASRIILLIYSEEFIPSISALQILAWAVFFSFLAHATVYTLNSTNRQIIYTKITFLAMVVNVALNLVFIPRFSFIGASFTTLVAEFIGFFLMFYYLKGYFGDSIRYNFMTKFIFIMLIISTILLSLENFINAEISFAISMVAYIAILILSNIITSEDIGMFKKIFSISKGNQK
jgi:O-antigen/teichoic acid export membrane protein